MKFSFSIPVTHKTIVNQQLKQVHIGDIQISGECRKGGEKTVAFDYDTIEWNGNNIFDLVQYKLIDLWEEINEATDQHCYGLLYGEEKEKAENDLEDFAEVPTLAFYEDRDPKIFSLVDQVYMPEQNNNND